MEKHSFNLPYNDKVYTLELYNRPLDDRVNYIFSIPTHPGLFIGSSFRPSPVFENRIGRESALTLMEFLCQPKSELDEETFIEYTSTQKIWAESIECSELYNAILLELLDRVVELANH